MAYIYYIQHPPVRPARIAGTDRPAEVEQFGTLALAELLGLARMCLHGRRPIGPRAREAGGLADAVDRTFRGWPGPGSRVHDAQRVQPVSRSSVDAEHG